VAAVIQELSGEKIDIIEWKEDPEEFVAASLSPAKVLLVEADKGRARVTVAEDQLSLAIGKDGQNVRLAAKLTGWKIDIAGGVEGTADAKGDEEAEEAQEKKSKKKKSAKKESTSAVKKPKKKKTSSTKKKDEKKTKEKTEEKTKKKTTKSKDKKTKEDK